MQAFDASNPEHIALARSSPAGWAWAIGRGKWQFPRHVSLWNRLALDLLSGDKRYLLEGPVRHGKTDFWCVVVPSWVLGRNPNLRVVVASYAATLPTRASRQAREAMAEFGPAVFGVELSDVSASASDWSLKGHLGGGYFAVGVGGALMGRGADLLVLDDLLDQEGALSQTQRDNAWEWIQGNALRRLEPRASVVGISTRYHADDVHGRLLATQGHLWHHVNIPAIAKENDPAGRQPGEALWPERYPLEGGPNALLTIKAHSPAYWWAALYDGNPIPEGGGILKPAWWADCRYHVENDRVICQDGWTQPVRDLFKFLVVDTALTEKQGSDYSVVLVCGLAGTGRLFLLDMDRRRMDGPDLVPAVKSKMAAWGAVAAWVERSTASLTQISLLKRAGVPVREYGKAGEVELKIPTGGGSDPKVPTYYAASTIVEAKRMWLPRASTWTADLEAELGTVPYSVTGHDDAAEAACVACLLADHLGGRRGLVADYVPPDLLLPPDPRTGVVHRVAGEVNHSPAPW